LGPEFSSTLDCRQRQKYLGARFLDFEKANSTLTRSKETAMEVLYSKCAGLDVHKDTVVGCIRIHQGAQGELKVRTFRTTTKALLELSDWLSEHEVTHVAMEATGVYWKPVWHVLDGTFEQVLANAMHIKNVPGRKTDVNDAQWIAELLAHGLIRASFVPPTSIQDMRTMMRTRKQLVRERAQHVQRIQKTLEDANIKIASAISDVTGVSGRAILRAIIDGKTNPTDLLGVTTGRLKASREELQEALRGRIRTPHRFLLKLHLEQIEGLEKSIADVDEEVGALLEPFRTKCKRLTTIPGISDVMAEVIVSEIGIDMSRFPTPGHLISWAGLCPRNDESAGKRRSTRLRMGAPWLKTNMVQAAWSAARCKNGYLPAQFHRIKRRRGPKKAIIAVAGSMLTAAYFIIRDDVDYRELGSTHFQRTVDRDKAASRLLKRLKTLGFNVEIKAA
jgi:transposase